MEKLLEYKLSHRYGEMNYALTQRMGFLPLAVTLVLFYAYGLKSGPGLWMAAGCCVSLQLILWSGHAIHRYPAGRSALGSRLVARSDGWFPSFLIIMQSCLLALTALIFWSTLLELGYRGLRLQLVLMAALLVLQPVRRIRRLRLAEDESTSNDIAYFAVYYLHWILLTLFVATTVNLQKFPERSLSSDSPVEALFIWIPAILVMISCIVLFIDHVLRKTPRSQPRREDTDTLV